jgi:hypothetical protein
MSQRLRWCSQGHLAESSRTAQQLSSAPSSIPLALAQELKDFPFPASTPAFLQASLPSARACLLKLTTTHDTSPISLFRQRPGTYVCVPGRRQLCSGAHYLHLTHSCLFILTTTRAPFRGPLLSRKFPEVQGLPVPASTAAIL